MVFVKKITVLKSSDETQKECEAMPLGESNRKVSSFTVMQYDT